MADDLAGTDVVIGLRILGSAGQLAAVFFGSDLSGYVIGHLVEGLETHWRHGKEGRGDRCKTVRPFSGFKRAANLDLLAENIGDGIAVFLLGRDPWLLREVELEHDRDLGRLEAVGDLGGLTAADDHGRRPKLVGENERALVVMDEADEAELELSFYDYQQSRFIGPHGLTSEPHFFRATVTRIGEKRGYLVGPEVTRCLRLRALIGIASRQGPVGDVPSAVRTYKRIEHGATIDIPANRVESSKDLKPSGGNWRAVGGDASGRDDAALNAAGAGGSQPQPQPTKIYPKREAQHWRRFAVTTGLVMIPLILAVAFALARLGWYDLVISTNGSLDFIQNARQSASEPVVFTPESASIEIRRALWARPFEGWWISKKPSVQIEFDQDGYWLNAHDQSTDRAIISVLRPNPSTQSTAATVFRTQLTFRNTVTGQVFATREATLRLAAAPPDELHIADADALVFTGFKGGPFNPESAEIGLSASGRDVRWSVQNIPSWIELTGGPTGKLNKDSSVSLTVTPRAASSAPWRITGTGSPRCRTSRATSTSRWMRCAPA